MVQELAKFSRAGRPSVQPVTPQRIQIIRRGPRVGSGFGKTQRAELNYRKTIAQGLKPLLFKALFRHD
jgi:hypothetical protein